MRVALLLALAGSLAACSAFGPTRVDQTRPSVSYRFQGDQLDEARARATTDCRGYNMTARLSRVQREATGNNVAYFDCV